MYVVLARCRGRRRHRFGPQLVHAAWPSPSGNKMVQERAWPAARFTPIDRACCPKWRVREVGFDGDFAQSTSHVIWTQVRDAVGGRFGGEG